MTVKRDWHWRRVERGVGHLPREHSQLVDLLLRQGEKQGLCVFHTGRWGTRWYGPRFMMGREEGSK